MNSAIFRYIISLLAFVIPFTILARKDNWPQSIPPDLPLYTKGTPRLHYNLVPQYNLSEDNLTGPVDSCAVYKMKEKSEWGEKTIVKNYLWRETSYSPQGYRKQRKEYYIYADNGSHHLGTIEEYIGNPNIEIIKVFNRPEYGNECDIYTFSVIDNYHRNVLLTRASGEQSMWKSIIDPPNGLYKLEYFDRIYSEPEVTYTNFFGTLYTLKESSWMQTLKNLFNERELMHTNTPVYALNDGLFLTPPYSNIGEYTLYQNNETGKIVKISPTQETIDEGIASVKKNQFDKDIAYCTIDIEYNEQGDYSKISFIQHELVKNKKPNGIVSYSWNEKTKWCVSYEYEYDSHDNWIFLRNIDIYGNSHYISREIFYSDSIQEENPNLVENLTTEDVLADPRILSEGLEYKIESSESTQLIANTNDGQFICSIPSDDEFIIRIYNKNHKWESLIPADWDCDYCFFKDYRIINDSIYLILSTHANGVGGTCCSYDVYKYNLITHNLEKLLGCACECEIVDNKIKATILELISGDNWQNYKYKEHTEWIEMK